MKRKYAGPAIPAKWLFTGGPSLRKPGDPCSLAACHLRRCKDKDCGKHVCACISYED